MPKVSKELIEFKKLLEEDEIETYKNDVIEELKLYFNDQEFLNKAEKYVTTEKNHNQVETREYFFTNDINWINNKEKWTNLKSIGCVKKYSNKKLIEERYFISDIDCVYVKQLANVIRSEWHIENNLHGI